MLNKLQALRAGASEEGFTLIELMIVVVIIGILAAVAVPIFSTQSREAIITTIQSDVKNTNTNIATALVKAPTAVAVTGNSCSTSAPQKGMLFTAGPLQVPFDIVKTRYETCINISGDWKNYYIHAMDSTLNEGVMGSYNPSTATIEGFGVVYTSGNGKLTTNRP